MGVRKNSFVVNSIISHFPVKWEVFLLNFFKRQSCSLPDARLVLVNKGKPEPLAEIADKTIALDADILETLHMMVEMKKEAVSCA